MLQDSVFIRSEGDRWFDRNRAALEVFQAGSDLPLKLLELYDLRPERALEIGAANGFRLAAIEKRSGGQVVAVEPSAQAIADGLTKFPCVHFVRGSANHIPLKRRFELIIVNFVFHWIDRANLLCVVSEIDRLLEDGGFLIIGDFQPVNRLRVPYHHLENGAVRTYKQSYAEVFLASGMYHSVSFLTGHHAAKKLDPRANEHERIAAWLLRKDMQGHYVEMEMSGHRA
jgi:SAM-dependent methyltransferase